MEIHLAVKIKQLFRKAIHALLFYASQPFLRSARLRNAEMRYLIFYNEKEKLSTANFEFISLHFELFHRQLLNARLLNISCYLLADFVLLGRSIRSSVRPNNSTFSSEIAHAGQGNSLSAFAHLYWNESLKLQLLYPLPFRTSSYKVWWMSHGPRLLQQADRLLENKRDLTISCPQFKTRKFGVNLIGHAFSLLGLGEYLRMIAKALEAAEISFCVVDIPLCNSASNQDRSLQAKVMNPEDPLPYAFNIFCMTADAQLDVAVKYGLVPNSHFYSISCWFWEMDRWPKKLIPLLDLSHEFWPCTRLIETALNSANKPQPIVLIPPVIDIGEFSDGYDISAQRTQARVRYDLAAEAVLFIFSFDLNSTVARKNPHAVLDAFLQAFGSEQGGVSDPSVGLVIKTYPPNNNEDLWLKLKAIASSDSRISIIEANLDRYELLALYGSCDAFVSLHRSEGLGLSLAEALQLGLDVIATGYGGNTDFLNGPLSHTVPYNLVPVREGEYPYHHGMVWAEPDVGCAAEHMFKVFEKRRRFKHLDNFDLTNGYRQQFSALKIGRLYRKRLEYLWQNREKIQSGIDKG